ncbi:MAG: alcohol dehydrogenase catalytic domain-containing protein [Acidimicrobiia bacterium]|nr:alcohol dehydrogenase catalytic domain-containing protein [Acidimicrobiia bacterium]
MDVLRLHDAGDIRLHTEPEPIPGAGEELVRVTAVGLCGSDLHWFEEGGIGEDRVDEPFVLGHEMGGVVASGKRRGCRVVIEPASSCGRCDVCLRGHANLCQLVQFCGHYPTPGGLSTFIAWPQHLLIPVPDTIEGDDVALLEPLGIALHAIDLSHFEAGMTAGVYGCGPIGLFIIRALRAAGAGPIQASDPLPHRLEAARDSGADDTRLTGVDGQPDGVYDWGPVDVAFEAAGEDAALETALRTVRTGGRVVVVGIPPDDRSSFPAALARERGLTIVLSRRMKPQHMHAAIKLVDRGAVSLYGMITSRYAIGRGPEAFAELVSRSGLKVVIKPSE